MKRGRRCGEAGFTLLEVMVAVAILAGTIAILQTVASHATRRADNASTLTIAKMLARERLGAVVSGVETGTGGQFEDYPAFSWEAATAEQTIAGEQTAILVTVTVRYPTAQGDSSFYIFDTGGTGAEDSPGIIRITTLIEPPDARKKRTP